MTGLERNADVVRMASYAPLFANTEAWQWTPDLIWVDSLNVCRTPSYYVQQLFSRNRGDIVLPVKLDGVETSPEGRQNLYASATRDNQAGEVIIKAVNPGAEAEAVSIRLDGLSHVASDDDVVTLSGDALGAVNSMADLKRIVPVESKFENAAANFSYTFPARSMTVLRIKLQ
jgi:alpha-N-arabinofuranosidase